MKTYTNEEKFLETIKQEAITIAMIDYAEDRAVAVVELVGKYIKVLAEKQKEIEGLKKIIDDDGKLVMKLAEAGVNYKADLADKELVILKLKTVAQALQEILDIGKRNTTNPKYDSYYKTAKEALSEWQQLDNKKLTPI